MSRVDAREAGGWAVYERLYGPLGPERLDYLFAMLAATIANANRGKGKTAYKPAQFAPRWVDVKRWPWAEQEAQGPMTGEQMLKAIKGIHAGMAGKGVRRGNA